MQPLVREECVIVLATITAFNAHAYKVYNKLDHQEESSFGRGPNKLLLVVLTRST